MHNKSADLLTTRTLMRDMSLINADCYWFGLVSPCQAY